MIKKTATLLALTAAFLVLTSRAQAVPPLGAATLDTPGTTKTLVLPPAADNSPVISLGTAVDPATGKLVEGLAIIHRKDSQAKAAAANNVVKSQDVRSKVLEVLGTANPAAVANFADYQKPA